MSDTSKPTEDLTRSQKAFIEADESVQRIVRQVLTEERQVMHLKNRVGEKIHQKILDLVKSIVR